MSELDDLFADLPDKLTVAQTAELLGVSDTTIYKWLKEGVLPGYRLGGLWVLFRDQVKDRIASGHNSPPGQASATDPLDEPPS